MKYKVQNIYDRLVHGKREKAAAQVAFMVVLASVCNCIDHTGYEKKFDGYGIRYENNYQSQALICSICILSYIALFLDH